MLLIKTTNTRYKINYIGKLSDDISLNVLYNALDVMVVPSLQENLSNAIMESLMSIGFLTSYDSKSKANAIYVIKKLYNK